MQSNETVKHLASLAEDIYTQGYACNIPSFDLERWFTAYALTMLKVAAGEPYTEKMLGDAFNEIGQEQL